jgi:hypothetical protein
MKKISIFSIWVVLFTLFPLISRGQALFTKTGTDLTWAQIIAQRLIPIGQTSTAGITGSRIDVNNTHPDITGGLYGKFPFDRNIRIHTVGNSGVSPADFPKWSRWYQEDGNTQVFRMFKDEVNVRNDRAFSGRIEAFSNVSYKQGDGWQEFSARYTIVEPIFAAIMQVKDGGSGWASVIKLDDNGNVDYQEPGGRSTRLASNMKGKSFDLKVRDDGFTSEIFYNGQFIGRHNDGVRLSTTGMRWGLYVHSDNKPIKDGMIFVTGASVNRKVDVVIANNPPIGSFTAPTLSTIKVGYTELFIDVAASDPDNDKIENVTLKINGKALRTETNPPYEWGKVGITPEETLGLPVGTHLLEAVITDSKGATKTVSKTIKVIPTDGVTSVNEEGNGLKQIEIFPNPSKNGVFRLNAATEWEVFTASGESILSGNSDIISLNERTTGLYLLRTNNEVHKIVVQ